MGEYPWPPFVWGDQLPRPPQWTPPIVFTNRSPWTQPDQIQNVQNELLSADIYSTAWVINLYNLEWHIMQFYMLTLEVVTLMVKHFIMCKNCKNFRAEKWFCVGAVLTVLFLVSNLLQYIWITQCIHNNYVINLNLIQKHQA